ncbi:glutamate decarboxylase, partial [Shigella dysenteriae]
SKARIIHQIQLIRGITRIATQTGKSNFRGVIIRLL